MLVNVAPPTHDFLAIARYLIAGKSGTPHPDRVAWVRTLNLPTDDPARIAKIMTATATLSRRCSKPAYHTMIAWSPAEQPSPTIMQEIALQTLTLAGLAEHEALIMGHGDRPHPHLHMLINRVHPDTGRAWDTKHDYALFDRIMQQLADAYGFQYAPAHRFNTDLTDDQPKKSNSSATWASKRGAMTTRTQWSRNASRHFGAHISEKLDQAGTWDDVDALLADHGLQLEAKGQGHIVGNDASYSKLSALRLTTSAHQWEKRFGCSLSFWRAVRSPTRHAWFDLDRVDIVMALERFGLASRQDVRTAISESTEERRHRQHTKRHQNAATFLSTRATDTTVRTNVHPIFLPSR